VLCNHSGFIGKYVIILQVNIDTINKATDVYWLLLRYLSSAYVGYEEQHEKAKEVGFQLVIIHSN
jgi:hypothetical protein